MPNKSAHVFFILRPPVENYPPTLNQIAIFTEQGFRVTVLCRPSGALRAASRSLPAEARRIDAIATTAGAGLPSRLFGVARFQWAVRHWVKKLKPDIVIACDAEAAWAMGMGRRPGERLVWHFHELPEHRDQGFSVNLANRWVWRYARRPDLIVFPDPGRAAVFAKDADIDQKSLVVVPNCPRPIRQLPRSTTHEILGERIPADARIVLYHGAIGPDHALETAIESMRFWPEDVFFVLKGHGAHSYIKRLESLAASEGIAERLIIFTPEFQAYDDHCAFVAGADLGWTVLEPTLLAWKYSTYASNKRFECMSLGVPQITDNGTGLYELVEGSGCGRCVPTGDAEVAGQTIASMFSNGDKMKSMRIAARNLHLTKFNYDLQYESCLRRLRQLIQL